jgi:hypothetical protein
LRAVDDLPWLLADASDLNTVDIAGLPPGEGFEGNNHVSTLVLSVSFWSGTGEAEPFCNPGGMNAVPA